MRTFSRIGLVSAAAFASLVTHPGLAQPVTPTTHSISSAVSGQPFSIAEAKGHCLALHFLRVDTEKAGKFVGEYLRAAPLYAGVRHVFVRSDDAKAVKAWAEQFKGDAGAVYVDTGGALAKDLGVVATDVPATIVLDTESKELFRIIGKQSDDYLPWATFASQFAVKTKAPAIADYNLPSSRPLAVEGYDIVAYFTPGKAVKGNRELVSNYRGVMYLFSTEANRALFAADPEKYLPTYGGWCASAMGAKGTKVEVDPTNFKVRDGRLFLFFKGTFGDALKDWNKHEKEWEPAADKNWKKLTNEEPFKPSK